MAGPIAIDTPDYQRGVVNAQKLLAHVTGIATSVIVGIPPNTETLVVTTFVHAVNQPITVTGQTTGVIYPSVPLYPNTVPGVWQTYWVDVSQSVDDEVEVQILGSSSLGWYVYADSGVHLIADVGGVRTLAGIPYTIPIAPSESAGDHPPVELQSFGGNFSANGNVLAAPGAGFRYRVFHASAVPVTGGSYFAELGNSAGGALFLFCSGIAGGQMSFYPSGLPCGTNAPIFIGFSAAGEVSVSLAYTTEVV